MMFDYKSEVLTIKFQGKNSEQIQIFKYNKNNLFVKFIDFDF